MKQDQHPHEKILAAFSKEFKHIMHSSPQGVYMYIDDEHKVCNEKFAKMMGYKSAAEWAKLPTVLDDVVPSDHERVIKAYTETVTKSVGNSLNMTVKNRFGRGKAKKVSVVMVPISVKGEICALHFVSPV